MRLAMLAALAVAVVSSQSSAEDAVSLKTRIQAAAKGSVVQLPEGTIKAGDLTLGEGVSLQGAGYAKTIIDATGLDRGIVASGKSPLRISGLTVLGASQVGIALEAAEGVTIDAVAVRKCGSGILAHGAANCKFQNLIVADNRSGVVFSQCTGSSLANATVANNETAALRISNCRKLVAFNNLLTYSNVGIFVDGQNTDLAIDHNLYIAINVGRLTGETTRRKVEAWATLSGYDVHSLTTGVTFKDAAAGDYRVVSPLSWAPIRATTSDWGVKELAGVAAPAADIDGQARVGGVDLGAYETSFPAPRPPDGTLAVTADAGVTSAGLFTPQGRCVRYLFQNLPLAKGQYPFWLPSRDWQGRTVAAGDYALKVTQANLRLEYVAAAGNGDQAMSTQYPGPSSMRCSLGPQCVAFDAKGRLIVTQDGFESGQHVRAYDPEMTHLIWSSPGGGGVVGAAVDPKGRALVMRTKGSLIRLDGETGKLATFSSGSAERSYAESFQDINGMAWLGQRLYVADPKAGKLVMLSGENLDPAGTVDLPGAMQPAADEKAKLLWVISGKDIVALDDAGTVKHRSAPVEQPTLLTAGPSRLAVYSATSRKITVFDSSDAANLKVLRTIGTGDDGYGKIEAQRFWAPRSIALGPDGQLAVSDAPRTCLFGPDGQAKRLHMGIWGQGISYGWFAGDDRVRFFNIGGGYDIVLDAKGRRWEPGTRWRYTMEVAPIFFFNSGGKNFGLFSMAVKDKGTFAAIVRMEDSGVGRVLARYGYDKEGLYRQRDTDGDGIIKDSDPIEPVLDADGKRITEQFFDGGFTNTDTRTDGSLAIVRRPGMLLVPMTGLDAGGVPNYDFAHRRLISGRIDGSPKYVSPYDFKTPETVAIGGDLKCLDDGGFVAAISTASGPGPDPATEHSNGTSMAGFGPDGELRWFSPMNPFGLKLGFHGITNVGGITIAGRGAICEFETMDGDGLGTGVLGTPRAMGWLGMWLDNHRQVQAFTGNDGRSYLIVGDYCAQSYHWMALTGQDKLIRSTQPVKVTAELAAALQAQPASPVPVWPVPPPPRVTIRKLPRSLPIDGDLAKWRGLGIIPILLSADDPADNSAVVRMGYADDALFVQVIKFDNVLTFHQREPAKHYMQDGIEFNINTFWSGWKYNVTRLANKEDIVLRDRFMGTGKLLSAQECQRAIRVLDSAADVPERKLLEAFSGADMSKCKVMVIEFRLGKEALADLPADRQVHFAGGKGFLFGITVNENDVPGSDSFAPIAWPATYGTFSRDNDLATAVFE